MNECGICPTCGPTVVGQHPGRPDVTRCANCKEWLRVADEDASRQALAAMTTERDHWRAHAEEAGRGFEQLCRDYARVSALVAALTDPSLNEREADR